jgi:hypothetical protein
MNPDREHPLAQNAGEAAESLRQPAGWGRCRRVATLRSCPGPAQEAGPPMLAVAVACVLAGGWLRGLADAGRLENLLRR